MMAFLAGMGWFLVPMAVCSLVAVLVMVERLIALRTHNVLPPVVTERIVSGAVWEEDAAYLNSVAGRILFFFQKNRPEPDGLKAFANLEVIRLERGLFMLDVVIGAAPLLGLLGTVAGLMQVFSGFDLDSGVRDQAAFIQGIAMALGTTMLGLVIAIPAMVGSAFLYRRVDMCAAQINVGVERLVDIGRDASQ